SYSTSFLGKAGVIEADKVLKLKAAERIVVEGSEVNGKQVGLKAGSVEIKTTSKTENFYSGDKDNHVKESSTAHFASAVNGQDIVILSTGSTRLNGSKLKATRDLRVVAGDIDIDAVNDSEFHASRESISNSFSETISSKKAFRSRNIGSELNGATVVLITEQGDIALTGSEVTAGKHLAISSAGDIRVVAGHNDSLEESYQKKSGWFSGGSLYAASEDLQGRVSQTAVSSKINAGSVELEAVESIELTGVDVVVADSLSASAQDITLRNASSEATHYSKHTEISVGFDDLASNLTDIDELISEEDGKLSLKLAEAKYEHAKSVSTQVTAVASQIQAGNIRFNAGGEDAGDVLIEGSDLLAVDSIEINASGDVALLDAHHISTSEKKTQTGTAELSLTLQNEYEQVSRSIKAVKQAERDLNRAQDDYDQYEEDLATQQAAFEQLQQDYVAGVGFIEQADIDDFKRYLGRMQDDEEFYKANIALATATLTTQTTQLLKQTARAAKSSATYGFNAGLELDIDALEQRVDAYFQQSRASNLSANQIEINAGDTALVRGATLQATDSIEIAADDIKVLAGVSTSSNSTRNRHVNVAYSWDLLGADSSRDPDQLGGSVSGDRNRSDGDTTRNSNAQLLAANIRLNAKDDTTIAGADIHASDSLEINTENLNLASVQNSSFNKTRSQGLSVSRESRGINAAEGDGESVQTLVTRLSGQQVDITVGNHTEIKGAVIAAVDREGKDNDQLNLSTNTLNASSLNSTVNNTKRSLAVDSGEVSSFDYQKDGEFAKTKSLATLGSGDIRITDSEGSDTRMLNSDIENTEVAIYDLESHQGLSGELDTRLLTEKGRAEIGNDIEATRVATEEIINHVQAWTNNVPTDIKQQVGAGLEQHYDNLILSGYDPEQIDLLMQNPKMTQFLEYAIELENELASNGARILEVVDSTELTGNRAAVSDQLVIIIPSSNASSIPYKIRFSETLADGAELLKELPREEIELAFQLVSAVTGGPVKVVLGEVVNRLVSETVGEDLAAVQQFMNEKTAEYLNEKPSGYYEISAEERAQVGASADSISTV
ncbi:MAG: hemagglutinin repeat-containing protein, partial [Gammaproteobacteria bacterium]